MPVLSNALSSSSGVCTTSPDLSVSMQSDGFKILWNTFRDNATKVADEPDDTQVYHDKVVSLLETLQKLIFGLGEGRKTIAVKNGALELIIKLSDTLSSSDRVVRSALKAIKSCVVKNPTGRQYCRSAGILNWMKTTLQASVAQRDVSNATLVEESITTLAAICLGDDLNALQGTMEFRSLVDIVSSTFARQEYLSLNQKVVYLRALFDAMDKEQEKLLARVDIDSFFETVRKSELILRSEFKCEADAEVAYSEALTELNEFSSATALLETLLCKIYERRSTARMYLQDWQGCLEDVEWCLSNGKLSQEHTISLRMKQVQAMQSLRRFEEAEDVLGKAILLDPKNDELQRMLQQLSLERDPVHD